MLAPRKQLWSTPAEVVDKAIDLLGEMGIEDVVFDVGAGDGRFLIRCAERTDASLVGVEINEERGEEAKAAIAAKGFSDSKCKLIIGNALEQDFSSATCFFLYLVPRGLKIILPILKGLKKKLRVVTYMSPFPSAEIKYAQVVKVSTAAHPEAAWPLYVYEIDPDAPENIITASSDPARDFDMAEKTCEVSEVIPCSIM